MNTTVKDPDPGDLSRDAIRRAQDQLLEVVAMLHTMEDDPEVHRLIDFDQPNNWPAIANKLHGNVLSTYRWYTSKLEKQANPNPFLAGQPNPRLSTTNE